MKPDRAGDLIKLSGKIVDYKCTRSSASFVFTQADQAKMGVVAIAAGLAGMGGQAMSTAANASEIEEDTDFIEFTLNGKPVKGWVWRSPFQDGDHVDVAAEIAPDGYQLYGVARPMDRIMALYPHCSRGKASHYKNAAKWWFWIAFIYTALHWTVVSITAGYWTPSRDIASIVVPAGTSVFFGLMVFSLSRQWLPFARVAENVFRTLGWPNPSGVDLNKTTKARRKPNDAAECGTFYFYY